MLKKALGTFEPAPSSVPEARRFVRRIVARHGGSQVLKRAELLVSELVTNAIRQARAPVQVEVGLDDRRLRVEVYDNGEGVPQIEHEGLWADHGRGLLLVARLSDRWGVEPARDGKRVWFELASGV